MEDEPRPRSAKAVPPAPAPPPAASRPQAVVYELPAPPAIVDSGSAVQSDGIEIVKINPKAHQEVRAGRASAPSVIGHWRVPEAFVATQLRAPAGSLCVVEAIQDAPKINRGDRAFVDTSHILPSPSGLYALRDRFGMIIIESIEPSGTRQHPTIRVLHGDYMREVEMSEVDVFGRVVGVVKAV